MAERTVSIDSMSKTYSVTGWRIGWVIAPPELTVGVRRVHDFLTVGAAAPLQQAAVAGLTMADAYYEALLAGYRERRDVLLPALEAAGFRVHRPAGAYYAMTDIRDLTDEDDVTFARRLIADPGVAAVPGSSFFSRPELGRTKLRFAFPKRLETLRAAADRLAGASRDRAVCRPAAAVRLEQHAERRPPDQRRDDRDRRRWRAFRAGSTRRSRGRRGAGTGPASWPRRRTRSRRRSRSGRRRRSAGARGSPIVEPTRALTAERARGVAEATAASAAGSGVRTRP